MQPRLFLPTLCLLIFSFTVTAQETPKTLLWRVAGKNFSKPCYLYGTMHTKDKRAYYLGDSVYSSLSFCDGFAMEVDPGDLIDTVLVSKENEEIDIAYRQAIETDLQKREVDYKKSAKALDSFFIKLRLKYDKLPARYFNRLERAYRRRMKNDMKTALDLYLFDLAKRQGKTMGGVEDIKDQTSVNSKDDKEFDEDEFLKKQKHTYADMYEWMIETYADADLDQIIQQDTLSHSKAFMTRMLYNRNEKMARRMDSLGNIRSTFFAVGCAHLPADSGVIDLLRRRGFTVTPVFSSKKIEPGDIRIDNQLQTLINIYDVDSNYVVQMPGKPTWLTPITRKISLKTYKELSNEILLMCGVFEDGKAYKTVEKEVEEMKDFFSRYDEIRFYNTKKITRQQLNGYEVNFRNNEGYIRLHVFCNNGKTYFFAAGSKEKDSLSSVRCENYLASYQMNLNKVKPETNMLRFEAPDKAFGISMPAVPKRENVKGSDTYTNEEITLFSSLDTKLKLNYLVLVKEPFKGYFAGTDSSIFTQTVKEVTKTFYAKYSAEENVTLDGLPALKMKIVGDYDSKSQLIYTVMAFRQNRFYCVTARGLNLPENEVLFDKYINSFRFTPYLQTSFNKVTDSAKLFSVNAPSAIEILQSKPAKNKTAIQRTEYYAFDSSTAMSYDIIALPLNKYYWIQDEQALLNEYATIFFSDSLAVKNVYNNDSLIYNKIVQNGSKNARELLIKNKLNNTYNRTRFIHYADSVFFINVKGDSSLVNDEHANLFFNSFRFTNEHIPTQSFTSKTAMLVKDLQSADSATWTGAAQALANGIKYPRQELKLLLDALLYNYQVNKSEVDIATLLSQAIMPFAGDETTAFIETNYSLLKNKREDVRMLMFNILSATKNKEAYQLLKKYFLNDPPSPSNFDIALANFIEQPKLSASLFPEVADKIKDAYLAPVVLDLANSLIDSSQLTYSSINSFEEDILSLSKKMYRTYLDNNYESFYLPHINAILQLLVKMNQKKANSLLQDFTDLQNRPVTQEIILAKVKNNQPVKDDIFNSYCELPGPRIELYEEMVRLNRQSFFIGKYASQQSFAEAFATLYTNNQVSERVTKNYDVVAIKEATVNGVTGKFYAIKVKCFYSYENISYTCFIGPFSSDPKDFSIREGKERYILYKSKYDEDKINMLFDDFISKIKRIGN